jgi:hypothetical protein
LIPTLRGVRWPTKEEEDQEDENQSPEVLPLNLQLAIRRARIRVEILGQETDAHVKYELFQRLNSGGANLSEQELRNCVLVAISKVAFENVKLMAADENFQKLAQVGDQRIKQQYLLELVIRFLVLRHYTYENGLDVHEYLDKGIIKIAENQNFTWDEEKNIFAQTMAFLLRTNGEHSFAKNKRFSLGMYEFITLGLSKAIERLGESLDPEFVKGRIAELPNLPEAQRYSGIGVRGTQRLANFVVPLAPEFFAPN